MDSLFILGIIPGTNIQISFELWQHIVIEFFATTIILWMMLRIYEFFKYTDELLLQYEPARRPLHATQLHQRAR